jgi:NodT family efflux transporter outer membrane factor (OMF) lipoprotein
MRSYPGSRNHGHEHSTCLSLIRVYPRLSAGKLLLASLALMAGCAVGPNYKRPDAPQSATFKEAGDWVVAQPADAAPKGNWWEVFNDPVLNALVEQANAASFTLASAEARYRQAVAAIGGARAQLFPTVGLGVNATRAGGTGSGTNNQTGATVTNGTAAASRYAITLNASWEPDLWGRVRREIEAASATAEASRGDLEAARLSLDAELATDYFQLRTADAQIALLEDTVKAFETNSRLTQNRYAAGVAGRVDIVQAESQLRSTQAQAIDLRSTRAQLEHAIAILTGKPPADLTIAPLDLHFHTPSVPPGVPSTLLQRRPDIAAAERRVAAANAQIGVAEAAYFPSLSLTGSIGKSQPSFAHLFSLHNTVWSIGADLAETLLDFGARRSQVEQARATYDQTVADYRQAVLTAMQAVEDNLAAMHWLGEETRVEEQATRAARESVVLTVNQYKAGTVSYLNVVQVQATQLDAERTMVTLLGRRLAATVALVRALGGTWDGTTAPGAASTAPPPATTPPPPVTPPPPGTDLRTAPKGR